MMTRRQLPMLCECLRLEGRMEHRDTDSTYVLWQLHGDASHAVFLDRKWLDGLVYTNGQSFRQLQALVPAEECCKMISRTLLGALKYKPDYLVIVSDTGAPLESGLSMDMALALSQPELACIRAVAEGSMGGNNFLGRRLTELCQVLADKGFFEDPKNRRYVKKAECQ